MANQSFFDNLSMRSVITFMLIAFILFFSRSLYTVEPEVHDARKKWTIAADLASTNDPQLLVSWDHHSSRWGSVIPAMLAIKINGENMATYLCLLLALFSVSFTLLLTCSGKDISVGLLFPFGVLLFFEPMFFRASTQLQPFVFGLFYLIVSLWLLCRYLSTQKVAFLVLSALLAFFAYGAKELYLFFVPGLLVLLFWKSGLRACVTFCSLLFSLFIVETLIFNSLAEGLKIGRIEFLYSGKHVSKITGVSKFASSSSVLADYYRSLPYPEKLIEFLFGRWMRLPLVNQCLVLVVSAYMAFQILTKKLNRYSNFSLGVLFLTISYSVLISITPLKLSPLTPLQPLWEKYLTLVMPMFVYLLFVMISDFSEGLGALTRKRFQGLMMVSAALMIAYALVASAPFTYQYKQKEYPDKDGFLWKYQNVSKSLNQGLGICALKWRNFSRAKSFIRHYDNDGVTFKKFTETQVSNIRVLHLNTHDPHLIQTFIPYNNYDLRLSKTECFDYLSK